MIYLILGDIMKKKNFIEMYKKHVIRNIYLIFIIVLNILWDIKKLKENGN